MFTTNDMLRYYKSAAEARRKFDSLVMAGELDKGKRRDTGEIVYLSKLKQSSRVVVHK